MAAPVHRRVSGLPAAGAAAASVGDAVAAEAHAARSAAAGAAAPRPDGFSSGRICRHLLTAQDAEHARLQAAALPTMRAARC